MNTQSELPFKGENSTKALGDIGSLGEEERPGNWGKTFGLQGIKKAVAFIQLLGQNSWYRKTVYKASCRCETQRKRVKAILRKAQGKGEQEFRPQDFIRVKWGCENARRSIPVDRRKKHPGLHSQDDSFCSFL